MFHLTLQTDNATFEDDKETEIARILRLAADAVEQGLPSGTLLDSNGNRVGKWSIE